LTPQEQANQAAKNTLQGAIEAQEQEIGQLKSSDFSFSTSTKGKYTQFMKALDRLTNFLRERISELPRLKKVERRATLQETVLWLDKQVDAEINRETNRSPFGAKYSG
jgi:hypothetical protein